MAAAHQFNSSELLYNAAQELGLQPSWLKPGVLFAVTIHGHEYYLSEEARSPLNSHATARLILDKYLTRLVLERHGMPNIPFAQAETLADAALFLKTYGKIIAKPMRGYGSRDIHVITDESQLQNLGIERYILEKYIAGKEMRYIILNGKVIVVHESRYGTSVAADRYLERISFPKEEWNTALVATTRKIAQIFDLNFGVVDFLVDPFGQAYILELNTSPGLPWLHEPTSGPPVNVARLFLESIIDAQKPVTPITATVLTD